MSTKFDESFRDSIATIDTEGHRNFIYPQKPEGRYYKWRSVLSWFLIAFLFAAPFIKVNGIQFILFNVLERKFNIFGFPFFPQDFHLFALSIALSVVFIILFTVVFGRIFCGWLCPQTIFMEMIFRKIEFLIEGDRPAQLKLTRQDWNFEKFWKRILKWTIFFIISFIISNVFLAYIIGSDKLLLYVNDGIFKHLTTFVILLVFTGVFYFIFAWFREQVCIIVCPYGRLQGVLLDNNSINVAYDFVRGENKNGRAKFRKGQDRTADGIGDCIDCKQCVLVCPTGIDIRNGTQLECINCTACIDACDMVMNKIEKPRGLIRYASEDQIENGRKFHFTPRLWLYTFVLTVLMALLTALLIFRGSSETIMLRIPGQTFLTDETSVQNVYEFKVINKGTKEIKDISFKLISHKGEILNNASEHSSIKIQEKAQGTVFIKIPKSELNNAKEKIKVGLYSENKLIETFKINFQGPIIIK